jgi:hypothetical protein
MFSYLPELYGINKGTLKIKPAIETNAQRGMIERLKPLLIHDREELGRLLAR